MIFKSILYSSELVKIAKHEPITKWQKTNKTMTLNSNSKNPTNNSIIQFHD